MKKSTICILTGPKGSGKTYTAREIISLHPRILAVDPHGSEFSLPGVIAVSDSDELLAASRANWKRPSWLIAYTLQFDIEAASESVAFRPSSVATVSRFSMSAALTRRRQIGFTRKGLGCITVPVRAIKTKIPAKTRLTNQDCGL
jgi:hypothetical protein